MNRSTILASIAALALLLPANSAQTTFPGPNPPCNSIQNAPVVVWNVSGGTLLGLIQMTLFEDAPLNTLTVLRGLDDAKAHSASWFVGDVPFGGVETALYDFIQTEFPGF